ncbi:uncharacterized protein LOC143072374 [Mytilus galloprovincialis]|uniref:uncharacterized protein LOC143072374 n=1 Tax=Mytilus galloprovincialis TaxID=29158 RepID=UPI003F7C625F
MSGLMTNKLDHLFKALTENAPITKDLITEAKQEYTKLRLSAQNGERLKHGSSAKSLKITDGQNTCPNCQEPITSHHDLLSEIRQLQTELNLKSQMCVDLQEQIRRRQIEQNIHSEQSKFADLNDPNRALKVGEMYSQLYDNQWMEAYQYLDNIMNLREDKILEILQRIIRGAYVFCEDIAKTQLLNLGGEISCPLSTWTENKRVQMLENGVDVSGKLAELTKTYRKSSSTECVPNLQKSFSDVILPTFFEGKEYRNEHVVRYAERCIAVTWYMTLQDPPMFLLSKIIRKADFDSDLFRPYTKSGDKYDFLVWPPLVLHENGPVVVKGVAQPLDSAISPLSLRSLKTPVTTTRNVPVKRVDSNNPALKGTPWGSQEFNNDPNAPSPSIDLPQTPASAHTPRGENPKETPIITYPSTPRKTDKEILTGTWKPDTIKSGN